MKVAILDKNPKTQFRIGHNYPVITGAFEREVKRLAPDWVFISVKSDLDDIRRAVQHTKSAYIYADYRNPLPQHAIQLSNMCDITLTSWKSPLWKNLKNPHVTRRATSPDQFYPIPETEPIYDVVFAGNNFGGEPRLKVLNFLNKYFNLYVVGAGWPSKFKQLGRKTKNYEELNQLLNLGKVTVDIFNRTDMAVEGVEYYSSNRLYQNMCIGRPHFSPYTPRLAEFFKTGYWEYYDLQHLKNMIAIMLKTTPEARKAIGTLQRGEVLARHTYHHVWKDMEKIIERNLFNI